MKIILLLKNHDIRECMLDYINKKFNVTDIHDCENGEELWNEVTTNAFEMAIVEHEVESATSLKLMQRKLNQNNHIYFIFLFQTTAVGTSLKPYFMGAKYKGKQDLIQVSFNNQNWVKNVCLELDKRLMQIERLLDFNIKSDYILFIHGFSGDSKTWDRMINLLSTDKRVNRRFKFEKFNYNTFKLLKYFKCSLYPRYLQTPPNIANVLKTKVERISTNANNIYIVGHSMGGVIIKSFAIKNVALLPQLKIKKVAFFSSPHYGSLFGFLFPLLGINLLHLAYIAKACPWLFYLNYKWRKEKVEEIIKVNSFSSYEDWIVSPKSSQGKIKGVKYYENLGHASIIRPKTSEDEVYKDFVEFLKIE